MRDSWIVGGTKVTNCGNGDEIRSLGGDEPPREAAQEALVGASGSLPEMNLPRVKLAAECLCAHVHCYACSLGEGFVQWFQVLLDQPEKLIDRVNNLVLGDLTLTEKLEAYRQAIRAYLARVAQGGFSYSLASVQS